MRKELMLKTYKVLLTLFPSAEVIREGHCGIPFAHWFASGSKWIYPYMRFMRGIGFGYFKNNKSQRQWVLDFIDWLDKYTVYRSYTEINRLFNNNNFDVNHLEDDYINYRLKGKGINIPQFIRSSNIWSAFTRFYFRVMAGMVILSTKGAVK